MARRAAEATQIGFSSRGKTTGMLNPSVATATEITEPQGPGLTQDPSMLGALDTTNGLSNVRNRAAITETGNTPSGVTRTSS